MLLTAAPSRDDPAALFRSVLPWLLLLLGIVILAAIVLAIVKRMNADDAGQEPDPFTLQGLREMLRTGQISQEEFDRMKAAMIERVQSKLHPSEEDDTGSAALDPTLEREARRAQTTGGGRSPERSDNSSDQAAGGDAASTDSPSRDDPSASPGNAEG